MENSKKPTWFATILKLQRELKEKKNVHIYYRELCEILKKLFLYDETESNTEVEKELNKYYKVNSHEEVNMEFLYNLVIDRYKEKVKERDSETQITLTKEEVLKLLSEKLGTKYDKIIFSDDFTKVFLKKIG